MAITFTLFDNVNGLFKLTRESNRPIFPMMCLLDAQC